MADLVDLQKEISTKRNTRLFEFNQFLKFLQKNQSERWREREIKLRPISTSKNVY